MATKTEVAIIKKLKQWVDPQTKLVKVQPEVLAHWMAQVLDMEQSTLKPFAVTENGGQIYTWNPTTETWVPAQLKDIYAAVRRDPAV